MRTIDGTRYISIGEYADLKGISRARVSQLKSTLPFEHFADLSLDLINYDLLELETEERALLEQRYSSRQALHQYSYRQLGQFFAKLLGDLTKAEAAAKGEARSKDEELNLAKNDLIRVQKESEALTARLEEAQQCIGELEEATQQSVQALEQAQAENQRLQQQAADQQARQETLNREKDELSRRVMELQEERAQHLGLLATQQHRGDAQETLRADVETLKAMVQALVKQMEQHKQ